MKPLVHAKDDWSAQNNIAIEHNFRQLEEKLRSGYQPLDATLTAFAALTGAADKLPYFTGADAFALADFTAFGRSLVDDANAAAGRTTLGLGTAAVKNTGTSGDTVPLCNTANSFGATQTATAYVSSGVVHSDDGAGMVVRLHARTADGVGMVGTTTTHDFQIWRNSAVAGTFGASGFIGTGHLKSSHATEGVGYATGAGGTVTQLTSKGTGVTLNKACGEITMNNAALAAGATAFFTLTNSAIAATDLLVMNHVTTGTRGAYTLNAECAAGSATIYVRNNTAGSLSEAIVIRFAVVKAVTA